MTFPESISIAGFTVYTRPYPTRVSVHVRENEVATGVPHALFAGLYQLDLCAVSLDWELAQEIASELIRSLSRYVGRSEARAFASHLSHARTPEALSALIGLLQQRVATGYAKALYRARIARHVSLLVVASLGHSISMSVLAPAVAAIFSPLFGPLVLSLLIGFGVWAVFAHSLGESWGAQPMGVSAGLATAGSALQVITPSALGAVLFFVGTLSVLASFAYWESESRKRLFPDPVPPSDPLPTSPHLHWPKAIAPAWYGNRRPLPDTANFISPEALWRHFQASPRGPYFPFAGVRMPVVEAYGNAALLGSPRSGKTKLMECMMRGLLPHARRALVYDPKRLFYPTLASIFSPEDLAHSYPFDARACVWNVAADCDTEVRAATFARARIPDRADQNGPYWSQSARALLVSVIVWLQLVKPGRWTLRDLVAATDREYLTQILKATEYGRYQYEQHLKIRAVRDSGRPDSVVAGLAAALEAFQPVAAAHDYHMKRGSHFSVRDWVAGRGPRCIVFSRDRENGAALDPFNQTLFDYVAMMLLDNPVSLSEPDTFVFLDELQEASELAALQELLSNGRERGVSTILSAQSVTALAARYGAERAKAIIDLCRSQAFLRLDSVDTAELASKLCGLQYFVDVSNSTSRTRTDSWGSTGGTHSSSNWSTAIGDTWGTQDQIRSEPLVSPGTLLELPGPSKQIGLAGLFRQEGIRAFHLLSPSWIDHHLPPRTNDPAYIPLDPEITGRFRRWARAEFLALASKQGRARGRNLLDRFFDGEDPEEER